MATNKPDLADWARNLIVKGLDNVAGAIETPDDSSEAQPTPLHRLADHWRSLSAEEREGIATRIIAGAGSALAAIPVVARAKRAAKPAPRRASRPAAAKSEPIEIPISEKKKDKKKKKGKKDKNDKKSKKEKKDKKKTKKK